MKNKVGRPKSKGPIKGKPFAIRMTEHNKQMLKDKFGSVQAAIDLFCFMENIGEGIDHKKKD